MRILILGGTGFIGNNIFLSLISKHNVTIASRKPIDAYSNWRPVDFSKENNWETLLQDIDLVINSIGIINGDFEKIQTTSPIDLYTKCIEKEISIVHISAIGADVEKPISAFLQSKKKTDLFLLNYKKAKIIYPGVVLGNNGESAQFFSELAHFPIIPVIKLQKIPFVHINQLVGLIQDVVANFHQYKQQVFAFSEIENLENIFESIKGEKVKTIEIPKLIFKVLFSLFPNVSIGIFNKATFELSQQNLTERHDALFPKASKLIKPKSIKPSQVFVKMFALFTISFIWIWSGISSLYSWDISMELMQNIGTNREISKWLIYTGSLIDIVLGITILSNKFRKPSLILQILVMVVYMLLLSIFAPEFWLHPFGVLTKNISIFALIYYLLRN